MIYFTSDTHFGHKNILKHCTPTRFPASNDRDQELIDAWNRGERPMGELNDHWKDRLSEHNETIIANWNARISPDDDVYHLGDYAFCCKPSLAENVLARLNGRKHLIWGNHDEIMQKKDPDHGVVLNDRFKKYWVWARHYHEFKWNGHRIVLHHFPIESWHKAHHGAWMLHGHCHGSLRQPDPIPRLDVGVDTHPQGLMPWSIEEVEQLMSKRRHIPRDHHEEGGN